MLVFIVGGLFIAIGASLITSSGFIIPREYYFILVPVALLIASATFLHLLYSLFLLKIKHLQSDHLTLSSDLNFKSFFVSNLINVPILVFSLGLAFPIVVARNIGLYANSVRVHGIEILETVSEHREGISGLDEILSQSFDLDILDVF